MTSVQYREATTADVPDMARSRLTDAEAGPADGRMAAYLDGTHHPQRALPPRTAYVAVADEAVVAYIAGHLTRRFGCDGEVQYLYVAPQYRRRGMGGQLLLLQASWFGGRGAARICVNVDPANGGARAFYEHHGATELRHAWYVWTDMGALVRGAG